MSLFNRIKNLLKPEEPPKPEKSVLTVGPGDVIEVSLVTYQVTGRTRNAQRNAILLTLQDGNTVCYLYIEERERTTYTLYSSVDGRLDAFNEVPTSIELEGVHYHLEEQYSGIVTVAGKTPFTSGGEQHVWQFQSDARKLLRIEWQDGRLIMYEGDSVIPADVQVLRSS